MPSSQSGRARRPQPPAARSRSRRYAHIVSLPADRFVTVEEYLRTEPDDQLVIDCPKGAFAVDEFYRDLPPPEPPTS